jgi:hypothetical protein
MRAGSGRLQDFDGPPRGFSFANEIQPILDRHCIRCHKDRAPVQALWEDRASKPLLHRPPSARTSGDGTKEELAFSLLGEVTVDKGAGRKWSDAYLVLTGSHLEPAEGVGATFYGQCEGRVVNWISAQSPPELLPPFSGGAARSELLPLLEKGHQGVRLSSEELEKFACWIDLLVPYSGDYLEANAWSDAEREKYERFALKREQMEKVEHENIVDFLDRSSRSRRSGVPMRPAGRYR